jgi:hypothetical protein
MREIRRDIGAHCRALSSRQKINLSEEKRKNMKKPKLFLTVAYAVACRKPQIDLCCAKPDQVRSTHLASRERKAI